MSKDLEQFEQDTVTDADERLETMTEMTSGATNSDSFGEDSQGQPPKTTEMDGYIVKKKSKLGYIIGGVAALILAAFVATLFTGSKNEEPKYIDSENIEELGQDELDSVINTDEVVNEINEQLINDNKEDIVIQEEEYVEVINNNQGSEIGNESNNIVDTDETVNNVESQVDNQLQPEVQDDSQLPVDDNKNTQVLIDENDMPPTTADVEVIQPTVAPSTKKDKIVSVDNTKNEHITMNNYISQLTPLQLREEADKLVARATLLESDNAIDKELIDKTPQEQVDILRFNLALAQMQLDSKNKSCSDGKKSKATTTPSKINANALTHGQIWINNKAYVVGDKLPNGSVVKEINNDEKTILTTKGSLKVGF